MFAVVETEVDAALVESNPAVVLAGQQTAGPRWIDGDHLFGLAPEGAVLIDPRTARADVASAAAEGARVDAQTWSSEIVRGVGVRGLLAVVGGTKRQRLYGSDQCAAGNEWRCLDAGQTRQLHWLQLASGGIANDAVGCSLPESRSWVGAKHCDRQTARECCYDSGKGRHEQLLLLFH